MAVVPDEDGDLPLHLAVVQNEAEVVDRLISYMVINKVPLDHQNNLRQTPLHLAVIVEQKRFVLMLLQGGSNPNLTDRRGMTCVQHAVQRRNVEILRLLLLHSTAPLDLDIKNYEGMSALHMAVLVGSAEMVTDLMTARARLDLQDGKSGRTAVFHAAENNHYHLASLLLQNGANVNIPSYSGSTAAQAASGRGKSDMVALLIKYGADTSGAAASRDLDLGAGLKTSASGRGKAGGSVLQMLRNNIQSRSTDASPSTSADAIVVQSQTTLHTQHEPMDQSEFPSQTISRTVNQGQPMANEITAASTNESHPHMLANGKRDYMPVVTTVVTTSS